MPIKRKAETEEVGTSLDTLNNKKKKRRNTDTFNYLTKILDLGTFPGTETARKSIEAAKRATRTADRRMISLKNEIIELKQELKKMSRGKSKLLSKNAEKDDSLAIREVKRAHIAFKPVAFAADEYFKQLIEEQKEMNLAKLNKIVNDAGKRIVEQHTILGRSTHAQKNVKWKFDQKDEFTVILMLAMRATGSQRTLKYFRQYFNKNLNFNVSCCWLGNSYHYNKALSNGNNGGSNSSSSTHTRAVNSNDNNNNNDLVMKYRSV